MSTLSIRLCGWIIIELIWAAACLLWHPLLVITLCLVGYILGTLFVIWVFSLITYGMEYDDGYDL